MLGNNVKSMEVVGKDDKNEGKNALIRQNTSTGSKKVLYSHFVTGIVIHWTELCLWEAMGKAGPQEDGRVIKMKAPSHGAC
jgi:hypothetical protein